VKVKELPDIPALRRKDGHYVDLGYKFNRYSGGEWVGYIGSSKRYLPLNKTELAVLMAFGGMKKLPPVPKRPGLFSGGMGSSTLLVFGGFLFILFRLVSFIIKAARGMTGLAGGGAKRASMAADMDGLDEAAMLRAQMRMEEMARQQHGAGRQPGFAPAAKTGQDAPAASMAGNPSGRFDASGRAYGLGAQPAPAAPAFGQAASRPVFGQRQT